MNNAAHMQTPSCKVSVFKKKCIKRKLKKLKPANNILCKANVIMHMWYYTHVKKTIFCITNQQLSRTRSLSFKKLHSDYRNSACRL